MNPGDLVAYGPAAASDPVAMAAGLVSFLSPCCLPLVPGYLAYVTGTAGADAESGKAQSSRRPTDTTGSGTVMATRPARLRRPSRTVTGTLLFVLGFAAVFTSYGAAFGAAGTLLLTYQNLIIKVLGVFTIVLGLMFTGVLGRIPLFARSFRLNLQPRVGVASAPLLGVPLRRGMDTLHRPHTGRRPGPVVQYWRGWARGLAVLRLKYRPRAPFPAGSARGSASLQSVRVRPASCPQGDADRRRAPDRRGGHAGHRHLGLADRAAPADEASTTRR